ncbi:hypothetical protein Dimus_023698 [Dionaea muscipula]
MDCNKDEAAKAKEIAEKKFEEKDIEGAKKLALKAHHLFPSLDGLPEFLATLDIYISANRKINGEVDWYGVLGIDPSADGDTVRRHYRKLALTVHPDKNKSVGADGAFKILSEAWSLLSDKGKRMVYDQKRNQRGIYQNVTSVNLSGAAKRNGFHVPVNNFTTSTGNQKNSSRQYYAAPPSTFPLRMETFWTACTGCWVQYEYDKVFLDKKLICPTCQEPFLAIQMAPPQCMGHQAQSSYPRQQVSNHPLGTNNSFRHGGDSTSSAAPATREEAVVSDNTMENAMNGKTQAFKRNYGTEVNRSTSVTEQVPKPAVDSRKAAGNGSKSERDKHGAGIDTKHQKKSETSSPTVSVDAGNTKDDESIPLEMSAPYPDFYDFDKDRSENSFDDNQVWAAYDHNGDGMPRYYAMVHGVISRKPFRMRMSWLNSKSNTEFARTNWVGCGFPKTSGHFRIGNHETKKSVDAFSHRVNWTKGTRGIIRIYPQKGDVWALYRNWSPDWNKLTPKELINKYDMVEVLEDYIEEKGVIIVPLVKVSGFKTVFRPHSDPQQVRVIPREEMFRFSHQVPSRLLTGKESPKALAGCRELDPAATPLETSEATEQTLTMGNVKEVTNDDLSCSKRTEDDESGGDGRLAKKARKIDG